MQSWNYTAHFQKPMVHSDVTSAVGLHLLHILSALCPHSRSLSTPLPQHLCIAFLVSPHSCHSPSAIFFLYVFVLFLSWNSQYSYTAERLSCLCKTVAETLSDQRLMYSAMVLLVNTFSVCSLLMSPLPFLESLYIIYVYTCMF